ncbi:polyribonucleotide nucleotidyltransferase [Miniphocaeibacter massiliensis]|uniref:polyribonucleotide nucleotidyltransferase n=1 Tax=Miniphocaeibacter massiliensis TaxID=2041841 RepID=UPI000C06AF62|nr:polyribonucleotide nucleotidyltransferase [Miniphocaeibacter massiliensis]
MIKEYKYNLLGKEIIVTIGKVAEQANGACLVQCGETIVLVTATASKEPRQGIDFFPLSCDFEEKLYSVGKIPGGFIKREGRASEKAILVSRLIDRPLRPLFPEGYRNDVQVIATALSVEDDYTPDILAMIGSSIALTISDIPFNGPTGSVSVGMVDGEIIINPIQAEREKSDLELTVAGTKEAIMMVEAGCNKITETQVLDAILKAHEAIQGICEFIEDIQKDCGKEKKVFEAPSVDENLVNDITEYAKDKLLAAVRNVDKMSRQNDVDEIINSTLENFSEKYEGQQKDIKAIIENIEIEEVRRLIIEDSIRPDNRQLDEIRPISCDRRLLPRAHGSGLFTRGQTQVLSVATLGSPRDVQILDGLLEQDDKRYMHQYNFPPYSVGDTRPMRGPGRREIGHGALAERALIPVLPSIEEFPYTIRVVSEVLSSNGSSSQASICGSTLALLDAGVPLKDSVAGIAMGLISDGGKVAILTDIQGLEDHFGDMDFKVAGTRDGITALQMDIKVDGISREVLEEALEKARIARLSILDKMNSLISEPEKEISKYAPRLMSIKIHPDKIREVIGAGGKVINKIIEETGVSIDTEDDGNITITAETTEDGKRAIKMIEDIIAEVEVGASYLGKVTRIMNFGAFVDILNGKEGLLHISKISHERVEKVEDVLKTGDEVLVKVTEIDRQGRINLSRKALLPKPEVKKENDTEKKEKTEDN